MDVGRAVAVGCLVALAAGPGFASTDRVWLEVADGSSVGDDPQVAAVAGRVVSLDQGRLDALLGAALLEGVAISERQPVVELPLPDGSLSRFRVEVAPVMAPGLAARFPEIRTYRGAGIDRVIFTDPTTDPYTHNDTAVLIFENQATLDTVIGSANYDHGHVFNTYNGGRAGDYGTACRTASKGQGVSGYRVAAGEIFMIDLVGHEMGHQLGAAHTYNSLERVCAFYRNEWAAYEPGSGSTIMSYAGVCGIENIEAHSDDYFHGFSLDEIGAYLAGAGGLCGSTSAAARVMVACTDNVFFAVSPRIPVIQLQTRRPGGRVRP